MDSAEGTTLDFCRSCGGVWLDAGEMAEMMQLLEAEPPADALQPTGTEPACPGCSSPMAELEHPPGKGVLIDVCTACHGTWLDRGEMGKLRRLARSSEGRLSFVDAQSSSPVKEPEATEGSPGEGAETPTEGGRKKRIVVPILYVASSEQGSGINLKWVILSTCIMMAGLAGLSLIAEALVIADSVSQDTDSNSSAIVTAITSLAFLVGGVMSGWKSPGHTIWEPAIAVLPSSLLFYAIFPGFFSTGELITMMAVGVVMAILGSIFGERYAHH